MPCSGPDLWSARQQCHLSYLAEFTSSIVHVPGKKNVVPNVLSRPNPAPIPPKKSALFPIISRVSEESVSNYGQSSRDVRLVKTMGRATALALVLTMNGVPLAEPVFPGFDVTSLSRLQESCSSVQEMRTNPSLSVISNPLKTGNILCDISTGSLSPLVPLQVQCQLFNQFHILSHPGVRASRKLIFARFVWLGMSRDVGLSCLPCQRSKMSNHVHSPVPSFQVPTWRFSHVYIDIVKPLPYFLTMMDKTTRGCSLVLHLCRVLCMCIYLDIDLQVWSSSSSHIRPRLSVHPCNLDWSVVCFGGFNLHYNLLSSSK